MTDNCTNKTTQLFFMLQPNLTNLTPNALVIAGHHKHYFWQQTGERSCSDAVLAVRLPCHNQSSRASPDRPATPHLTADYVNTSSNHPTLTHRQALTDSVPPASTWTQSATLRHHSRQSLRSVFSDTKCAVGNSECVVEIYLMCSSIFSNEVVQRDRF